MRQEGLAVGGQTALRHGPAADDNLAEAREPEAELRALSADQAEALRRAASTVYGFSISRESPLYRMNLVTVYARWRASRA